MDKKSEKQKSTNIIVNPNEPQNLSTEKKINSFPIFPTDFYSQNSENSTGIENELKEEEIIETQDYKFNRFGNEIQMIQKNKPIQDDDNYDNEIDMNNIESDDNKSEIKNICDITANSELRKKKTIEENEKIKKKIDSTWNSCISYLSENNNNIYNSNKTTNLIKTKSKTEEELKKRKY